MNVPDILADLEASGIRLEAAEGKLKVDAPKGAITEKLRAYLAEHKEELLTLLATEPAPDKVYIDESGVTWRISLKPAPTLAEHVEQLYSSK